MGLGLRFVLVLGYRFGRIGVRVRFRSIRRLKVRLSGRASAPKIGSHEYEVGRLGPTQEGGKIGVRCRDASLVTRPAPMVASIRS